MALHNAQQCCHNHCIWEGVGNTFFLVWAHLVLLRVAGFWISNLPNSCEGPHFARPCSKLQLFHLFHYNGYRKVIHHMIHVSSCVGSGGKSLTDSASQSLIWYKLSDKIKCWFCFAIAVPWLKILAKVAQCLFEPCDSTVCIPVSEIRSPVVGVAGRKSTSSTLAPPSPSTFRQEPAANISVALTLED